MRSPYWSRNGFSLVEMTVALAIFGFGVAAMLGVFAACLQSTGISTNYTRARLLAQGLLAETLAAQEFDAGEDAGQWETQFPGASWTRRTSATETSGLYEVHVAVTWTERGKDRQFELTTLAAER